MKFKGILFVLVMVLMMGTVGSVVYASEGSIFGESITSSMTELKKHFNITNEENVSITEKNGESIISMKSGERGYWIISKESVDYQEFNYTVELSGGNFDGTSNREISIFLGADERYMNGVQVYISKRGGDEVTVQVAEKKDGLFSTAILKLTQFVENASDASTLFKFELNIIGEDMDVYLNDEFLDTVTVMNGFAGRVGVRCSNQNDINVHSLSLVEVKTSQNTAEPLPTDGLVFPTDDLVVGTTAPTDKVTSVPSTQSPANEEQSKDGSSLAIIGIVAGVVVVICAVTTFVLIRKKKK